MTIYEQQPEAIIRYLERGQLEQRVDELEQMVLRLVYLLRVAGALIEDGKMEALIDMATEHGDDWMAKDIALLRDVLEMLDAR